MDKLFDNLKKGVSIVKNEAGRLGKELKNTTTNIVDITKLNLTLNDTEKKIKDIYEAIGEKVYNAYADGSDTNTELEGYCIEIDRFKKEIEALKDQISALKNTVLCPSCGQYNDKDSEYCSKCGSKLSNAEVVVPDDIIDATPENTAYEADTDTVIDVTPNE